MAEAPTLWTLPERLEVFEGAAPIVAVPLVVPDVQLEKVDGLKLEIARALLGAGDDVVVRKDVGDRGGGTCRPNAILRVTLVAT